MRKQYVVWSPSKFSHEGLDANNYEEMIAAEETLCGSLSSVVHTHDIEELIQAIYNETDIELSYHQIGFKEQLFNFIELQYHNARNGITYHKLCCQLKKLHANLQIRYQLLKGALFSLKKNKGAVNENN